MKHFDQDEASGGGAVGQHRAVLIVTDADVDEVPGVELAQLKRRNIVPYVVYINAENPATATPEAPTIPPFITLIRDFGGDYFDVTDQDSLNRAYEAIDRQEAVSRVVSQRVQRVPIYTRFLLLSMALLVVGIPAGFLAELFWGTAP